MLQNQKLPVTVRQELVFIGQGVDQLAVTGALDQCLLTEDEMILGKEYWATLSNPVPSWGKGV